MKRNLIVITIALAIITILIGTWHLAYTEGIHHAIYCSECYIVDYEDPDAPHGDTILYIDLDNEHYEHWLYIG